jgi:serine/threonine-protein kinase
MRALAKKPEERYASAGELAADLVRIGATPELAELAAAGLPATERTIVGAPITRTQPTLQPPSPTAPTVAAAPPAAVGYRRGLLIAGSVAAGLLVLLVAAGLGLRSCRQGPGNGVVQPPPPPKPEPGLLGDLVLPDGKRHRVRLLGWEGSLARVVELPGGQEKAVELPPGTIFEPAAPPAPPPAPGGTPK